MNLMLTAIAVLLVYGVGQGGFKWIPIQKNPENPPDILENE